MKFPPLSYRVLNFVIQTARMETTPAPHTEGSPRLFDRRGLLLVGGASILAAACGGSSKASPVTVAANSAGTVGETPATTPATTPANVPDTVAPAATALVETTLNAGATVPAVVETATATTLSAADFEGLASCVLLPEKTLGPFPLDQQFDRRDVTEGYDGHPVRLGLRVVDRTCAPVSGAKVEIWHADATGDYSAFVDGGAGKDEAAGTTFLRGTQTSNDEGIVEFLTVFPGWYRGRTPHIHLRVRVGDTAVLASQMFFDETYAKTVYTSGVYAQFGLPDTTNASDNIAGNAAAEGTILVMTAGATSRGDGTLALLNVGIDPAAVSTGGSGGPGGGPGGPPPGGGQPPPQP